MSRELISVGQYVFNTKKELRFFTKQMVQKLFNKELPSNHNFFFALIKRHPEYETKFDFPVTHFIAESNPMTGDTSSPHLLACNDRNEKVALSWNSCVTGKPFGGDKMLMAMRSAISDSIIKFYRNSKHECILCKSTSELEVDHVIEFSIIAEQFKERYNPLFVPSKFCKDAYSRDSFLPSDEEYKTNWINYHNKNCELQLLCKTCHKEKTKKQLSINART